MTGKLPVKVLRRAQRQIADAVSWWEVNRPKAPGAVEEELAKAFDLLAHQSEIGVRIEGTRFRGVRRIHLNRSAVGSRG